ncbi:MULTISPECIES: hypothetical protein [unclassified Flavobacterium]|uniref:hypothetical protein n=1 Tax=unclassified Flavobacterium TaxID=196869 RepID=UPI001291A812|nr:MULTISPECIES: hypothetical protein [unclassified Flavobacterium]MQP53053.1 hypothetical protein [Flavobacterium sp. LMO9]MQP62874.1 hypothetical protein [Flavobacterium sp. LMO6]
MMLKKSIAFFTALTLTFTMLSCEEDNSGNSQAVNYVGLENYQTVELSDAETVVVEGRILASEASGSDRTFNLVVDPSTTHGAANFSVPATVTIPAGSKEGIYEVTVVGNGLVDGNKIVVSLEADEATNQSTFYGTYSNGILTGVGSAKSTFNLFRPCASVRARLSITFDNYPEETAWELYDADFNVIDSGGLDPTGSFITGYQALGFADRSTFSVVKCLAPGTYTFVIYDDFGDGMYTSSTVSGSYSMNNLNNGASLFSGGGDFGSFSEHEFVIE